jgi:hypothetical protein
MRRVPGSIINGGGGVAVGMPGGTRQYTGKQLRWANPVIWKADLYTKVEIDLWASSQPNVQVLITGARDGDRLICSFYESIWGGTVAATVSFPGVNIGAATVDARVDEACLAGMNDPRSFGSYDPNWRSTYLGQYPLNYLTDCFFFFLKTRGQLYLTRVLWRASY